MITAIIADDEIAAISYIKTLASDLAKDLEIVGTATNGYEALQLITELKPDLVFLDVDMPGMSGMEILKKIPQRDFEVIFTTGYSKYALQAIKFQAADYLLKSIDPAEFVIAIAKVRERISLKQQAKGVKSSVSFVQFPTKKGYIYLEKDKIEYASGLGAYSNIHLVNKEQVIVIKSVGRLKDKLPEDNFFRCHNSHIINLDLVSEFVREDVYYVIMKSNAQVEVSRRLKDDLLHALSLRSH
jgi:two-component system LytT family response regulator